MEKAEADAKVLQEQIAALVEKATQMVDKSMLEHVRRSQHFAKYLFVCDLISCCSVFQLSGKSKGFRF
jgi:hypothetical protein